MGRRLWRIGLPGSAERRLREGIPIPSIGHLVRSATGERRKRRNMIFRRPGHAPVTLPVDGQGCSRWNSASLRDGYYLLASVIEIAMRDVSIPTLAFAILLIAW